MCQPVMVSQPSWHCEPHGTLRCTGAELDSLQSCSLIWHPWSSLVSFSFDTSRCSADLIPLSSAFFFSRWVSGDLWTSFNLAPWDDLFLSSSCMSLWFAVNLIIMSQDPIPKGSSVRESCKNDLTFQAAETTHYNYYIYIYRVYRVLYPNIWRICFFHYVSYLIIILWIIFFLMIIFKYSLFAIPPSLEYTILSIFEW